MSARRRGSVMLAAGMLSIGMLTGCGGYTLTFEVSDVINAWGEDVTREMLDVDIVCLTAKQAEDHPELVRGTMKSNQWFKARDTDAASISDIGPRQIYALRRGGADQGRDTLMGEALLSARDRDDGRRITVLKIKHPQPGKAESAFVIYGRFSDRDGVARTSPLVIQPPPTWKDEILIKVGRQNMRLAE